MMPLTATKNLRITRSATRGIQQLEGALAAMQFRLEVLEEKFHMMDRCLHERTIDVDAKLEEHRRKLKTHDGGIEDLDVRICQWKLDNELFGNGLVKELRPEPRIERLHDRVNQLSEEMLKRDVTLSKLVVENETLREQLDVCAMQYARAITELRLMMKDNEVKIDALESRTHIWY